MNRQNIFSFINAGTGLGVGLIKTEVEERLTTSLSRENDQNVYKAEKEKENIEQPPQKKIKKKWEELQILRKYFSFCFD